MLVIYVTITYIIEYIDDFEMNFHYSIDSINHIKYQRNYITSIIYEIYLRLIGLLSLEICLSCQLSLHANYLKAMVNCKGMNTRSEVRGKTSVIDFFLHIVDIIM